MNWWVKSTKSFVQSKLYWIHSYFKFTIIGSTSVPAFVSLVGIPIGITSSSIGLNICSITAGSKMYKPINKKKKLKHDKIVLLAKSKLNSVEVLISKALIDSVISHDEFKILQQLFIE